MSVSDTTASVLVGCDPKHVRAKTSDLRSSHAVVVVVDVFVSATNPGYATFRTHTHSHTFTVTTHVYFCCFCLISLVFINTLLIELPCSSVANGN